MQCFFPSLIGGNAQFVIPWNTTYKGNNDPFIEDEMTIVNYLLISIAKT
jgi:hypothetical protein